MPLTTVIEDFADSTFTIPRTAQSHSWSVTTFQGRTCLKSVNTSASSQAYVDFTPSIPAGAVNIKLQITYATDSEANFDFLRILLDGVTKTSDSGAFSSWKTVAFDLVPGATNKITFRYEKDGSGDYYSNAVYIDEMILTYQEPPFPELKTYKSGSFQKAKSVQRWNGTAWEYELPKIYNASGQWEDVGSYKDIYGNFPFTSAPSNPYNLTYNNAGITTGRNSFIVGEFIYYLDYDNKQIVKKRLDNTGGIIKAISVSYWPIHIDVNLNTGNVLVRDTNGYAYVYDGSLDSLIFSIVSQKTYSGYVLHPYHLLNDNSIFYRGGYCSGIVYSYDPGSLYNAINHGVQIDSSASNGSETLLCSRSGYLFTLRSIINGQISLVNLGNKNDVGMAHWNGKTFTTTYCYDPFTGGTPTKLVEVYTNGTYSIKGQMGSSSGGAFKKHFYIIEDPNTSNIIYIVSNNGSGWDIYLSTNLAGAALFSNSARLVYFIQHGYTKDSLYFHISDANNGIDTFYKYVGSSVGKVLA